MVKKNNVKMNFLNKKGINGRFCKAFFRSSHVKLNLKLQTQFLSLLNYIQLQYEVGDLSSSMENQRMKYVQNVLFLNKAYMSHFSMNRHTGNFENLGLPV